MLEYDLRYARSSKLFAVFVMFAFAAGKFNSGFERWNTPRTVSYDYTAAQFCTNATATQGDTIVSVDTDIASCINGTGHYARCGASLPELAKEMCVNMGARATTHQTGENSTFTNSFLPFSSVNPKLFELTALLIATLFELFYFTQWVVRDWQFELFGSWIEASEPWIINIVATLSVIYAIMISSQAGIGNDIPVNNAVIVIGLLFFMLTEMRLYPTQKAVEAAAKKREAANVSVPDPAQDPYQKFAYNRFIGSAEEEGFKRALLQRYEHVSVGLPSIVRILAMCMYLRGPEEDIHRTYYQLLAIVMIGEQYARDAIVKIQWSRERDTIGHDTNQNVGFMIAGFFFFTATCILATYIIGGSDVADAFLALEMFLRVFLWIDCVLSAQLQHSTYANKYADLDTNWWYNGIYLLVVCWDLGCMVMSLVVVFDL
jgi:hypothetical protein